MLTYEQALFLLEEKKALTDILLKLTEIKAPRDELATLQKAIMQLDELFLLVVVGEFNAGKSALVNAILGEKVLPEGVTPTTSQVTLVKWGEKIEKQVVDEDFATFTYPLPLLKELNIVDTPGTNAIIRRHERLTEELLPRSDLVLFTTSADRPMTESERQFLEKILAWKKKIILVLNKTDIIENEVEEVRGFILKHAAGILGDVPELFLVSARQAQRAAAETDEERRMQLRAASGLDQLENYITNTLDDSARLKLKFNNPIGVADHLLGRLEESVGAQSADLREDIQTVESIDAAIAGYERDLQNELAPRLAELETILQRLELRGLDFFDNTLRLTNIHNLVRGDKVRGQFEKEVLADVPQQIEEQVQRLIDWLVDKDLREWQQVMAYLQRRQALSLDHVVGVSGSPQSNRRRELIETVGKSAKKIIEGYDRTKEASALAASVEAAVAQTALFEAGAVGLGALVTTAVLSSALDITGTIAAGVLAIVGFFVIPYKRKQAKENFKGKMTAMRTNLLNSMTAEFSKETGDAIFRLKENVAPYTRYVRAEQERIDQIHAAIAEMRQRLSALRARIDAVVK
jgi:small GTP-binding protein